MASQNTKIVDILMMANSKILIPSAGSTFGYWSAFLGDSAVIMHPDHTYQPIRPTAINAKFYEDPAVGPAKQWSELLKENIRAIRLL